TNAASPKSKAAAGFAISIITSFSNSAGCPRYNRGRCVAVSGTHVRTDHAAAAPEIADPAHTDRSSIVPAAAAHPAEPADSGRCYRSSNTFRAARTPRNRMDWALRRANRHPPARPADIAYQESAHFGRCGSIR